ncbi:MAG TPA: acyltransferase [Rhizomicrobium sp.]|nr:acyltransferase [Rhizomicrobium sp.]
MSAKANKDAEIRALTGLRGAAAIFVAAFHFRHLITEPHIHWVLHKGYLSVDIFFVLSGFVMAVTYHRLFLKMITAKAFGQYIWLRVARIWPLYVVAVIAGLAVATFRNLPIPPHSILFNILMIQGWGLAPSINTPLWSVSTEFVAYLLFPILISIVARGPRFLLLFIYLGCLLLVSYLTRIVPLDPTRPGILAIADPYSLLPVFRCVAGFVLGLVAWRISQTKSGAAMASSHWAGAAIAAAISILFIVNANDLLIYPLFPILIICLAQDKGWLAKALGFYPVHWLGVLSFALYALHHPFLYGVEPFISHMTRGLGRLTSPAAYFGLTVAGLLLLSITAHFAVERPARLLMRRLVGRNTPPAVKD